MHDNRETLLHTWTFSAGNKLMAWWTCSWKKLSVGERGSETRTVVGSETPARSPLRVVNIASVLLPYSNTQLSASVCQGRLSSYSSPVLLTGKFLPTFSGHGVLKSVSRFNINPSDFMQRSRLGNVSDHIYSYYPH